MADVSVIPCGGYEKEKVGAAVRQAIDAVGGLDFVKPGMRVGIKANLVAAAEPSKAATTHPAVIEAVCDLIRERGGTAVIGDSPGGLYSRPALSRVYRASGMETLVRDGVTLNEDFSEKQGNAGGKVLKDFLYTGWLDSVDVLIDVCKLKTHGMMGMSAAAKNMFGTVPGTVKPEYHFRFPTYDRFADMIIDLDEHFKPALSVCDAIEGMEGNGPTAGTPRKIGCILASPSPHKLDLVAAHIIGLSPDTVPTLIAAKERGLIPERYEELDLFGNPEDLVVSDYKNVAVVQSLVFRNASDGVLKNLFADFTRAALQAKPKLHASECVGCGVCAKLCPARAIQIEGGKAVINRGNCIRCFCCQEFCPKGAMKVHRPILARIANKL